MYGALLWAALGSPDGARVAATADTWPTWRGDAAQTGRSPSSLVSNLVQRWTYKAGDAILSSAVVDREKVYFGVKDGTIVALDRKSGALRWEVKTAGAVEAPPLLAGGLLVVGGRDGVVRALEPVTGAERWRVDLGAEVVAAATVVPAGAGLPVGLLVPDYSGELARLDLADGRARWTYATGSYLYGSAAVAGDVAVIGGCDGYIHTVKVADGKVVARVEVGAYVGASVALDGGMGFVGHFGNKLIGFDPRAGTTAWSHFDRSFPYLSSPALTPEIVIVGGRDHVVRGVERKTGLVWWMFPAREKVDSSPVVVGDRVVIGSEDGRLYVLDIEDGSEKQSFDLGAPVSASPAVAGGHVFIGAGDGTFFAFGPRGAGS